ncbi:MAG: hypothetical protein ACYC7L_14985 [Nitrospirota bacterium]
MGLIHISWYRAVFSAIIMTAVILTVSSPVRAEAADSLLSEKEAVSLTESSFAETIRKGNCIVMYYRSDDVMKQSEGMTPLQWGDFWMRGMIEFRGRLGSEIQFYKVNWRSFSPGSMSRIRSDLATSANYPDNPTFAVYTRYNSRPSRVRGLGRPDMYPWVIHDLMDDFMPVAKKEKGDYLFTGWLITDTQSERINVVNERKEEITFNGKPESVQVLTYVSRPRGAFACTYERIYTKDGRLIASIEDYGPYGKYGYFDYDRTGRFQYRVRYSAGSEGTRP